ncbi:MAG: NAD(P)-dependent oxidoreductase [Opitutaceae bacterium]|jgi:dTDP-glucose 4,6-dehydratase
MNTALPSEDLSHVLAHTRELWAEARGQRFFITGGTGFFGRWLLESFCHANDELHLGLRATMLTRDPARFASRAPHLAARPEIEFVHGDVRTFIPPPGAFRYLVHAATEASAALNEQAPDEMLDTIVTGTRHVLDFAAQAGVQKLLFTSSGAVYGRQPSELARVGEDYPGTPDPLAADSAYGIGKRKTEQMCAAHAERHGCEVKIARGFAFVGPHLPLDAHFAIGNFIRDALAGGPIRIAGDGTPQRSYLYAADLAVWLWTMLFRAPSGRAYNVGSSEAVSIRDAATAVAQVFPHPIAVTVAQPASGRPPSRYVPSTARAENELGLRVRIPLDQAIERTVRWLQPASLVPG